MLQAGSQQARQLEYDYRTEPVITKRIIRRTKHKKSSIVLKFGAIVFIFGLILVYMCVRSAMLNYVIGDLQSKVNELNNEQKRMQFRIQELTSLDRIELVAAQELNMTRADWNDTYTIAKAPKITGNEGENLLLNVATKDNLVASAKPMEGIYNTFLYLANKRK